jgi:hypothetical protein
METNRAQAQQNETNWRWKREQLWNAKKVQRLKKAKTGEGKNNWAMGGARVCHLAK